MKTITVLLTLCLRKETEGSEVSLDGADRRDKLVRPACLESRGWPDTRATRGATAGAD